MKPLSSALTIIIACLQLPASAQVLQPPLRETLENTQRTLDHTVRRTLPAVQKPLQDTVHQVMKSTEALMATLPATLPLYTDAGKLAITEVTVENNYRAVGREWLVEVSDSELSQLQAANIEILAVQRYPLLELHIARIRVSELYDNRQALQQLLPNNSPTDKATRLLERNYLYAPQQQKTTSSTAVEISSPLCELPLYIGMIDTAVDTTHTAFTGRHIEQKHFLEYDLKQATAHGTAVAGLFIGRQDTLSPLLPAARLYIASVFYARDGFSQGATLSSLLNALEWLAQQTVPVINMSLAGPPNALLQRAIQQLASRHITIIAAAGNEGPAAAPAYPAGYQEVIAVTAVDQNNAIYRWAIQGDHVDFSALGVGVLTARTGNSIGRESGTSIAAPLVTAYFACTGASLNTFDKTKVLEALIKDAKDLGKAGRDPVFGYGLLKR